MLPENGTNSYFRDKQQIGLFPETVSISWQEEIKNLIYNCLECKLFVQEFN